MGDCFGFELKFVNCLHVQVLEVLVNDKTSRAFDGRASMVSSGRLIRNVLDRLELLGRFRTEMGSLGCLNRLLNDFLPFDQADDY